MSVRLLEITRGTTTATGDTTAGGCPEQVSLSDEAFDAVKRLPEKPLNLVTIWGATRTGKSFFMNAIAGVENGVFPVAGGSDPCTQGAFMSTTTCSLSAFSAMSVGNARPFQSRQEPEIRSKVIFNRKGLMNRSTMRNSLGTIRAAAAKIDRSQRSAMSVGNDRPFQSGQEPEIRFVDVEGQGDKHRTYETRLATPLLLLSKVVIFNWKGLMNRSTMLNSLGTMRAAAAKIDRSQRKGAFGHLIVLLRDVADEKEEQKTLKRLFGREEDFHGDDVTDEEEAQMKERNQIRQDLEASFQSIRVCCLPPPHMEICSDRQVSHSETSQAFRDKVGKLRSLLATEMLAEPHHFGGKGIVGGAMLSSLLRGVCKAANGGLKNFRPLSLMESVQLAHAETAYTKAVDLFSQLTAPRFDGVPPMSKADTTSALREAADAAVKHFTDQSIAESLRVEYRQKLEVAIAERVKACYAAQERQVADGKLEVVRLLSDANSRVDEQASMILARLPMPDSKLSSACNEICVRVHQELEASVAKGVSAGVLDDLTKEGAGPPTAEAFKRSFDGKFDTMAVSNRTQQSQVVNNELLTKQLRQREKGRVTLEELMEREERPKARQDARVEAHMINKLRVTKAESERRREDKRWEEERRDDRERWRRENDREDRKLAAESMRGYLTMVATAAEGVAKAVGASTGSGSGKHGDSVREKKDEQTMLAKYVVAGRIRPFTCPARRKTPEKRDKPSPKPTHLPKRRETAKAKPSEPEENGKSAAPEENGKPTAPQENSKSAADKKR